MTSQTASFSRVVYLALDYWSEYDIMIMPIRQKPVTMGAIILKLSLVQDLHTIRNFLS